MDTYQTQIEDLTRTFLHEIEALVRETAIKSVTEALQVPLNGTNGMVELHKQQFQRPRLSPVLSMKKKAGQKRDPKVLANLVEALHTRITMHGGDNIETIAKDMKRSTSELSLPIAKLLAAKRIRREGQKRATRYFPRKK